MIYYIIGQPHSGKTTLAKLLKKSLMTTCYLDDIFIIDGDELRRITDNAGYGQVGRRNNIETAHTLALYLNEKSNYDVIISMVSPYLDLREELKKATDVIEIYLHTTNIRGREKFHVENYQKPSKNFIEIDTTNVDEITTLNELLNKIKLKNGRL